MQTGNFYFLKNEYFIDFPDNALMQNKEFVEGEMHNRPCYFAFCDKKTGLYWMVPISSKVLKYKAIYEKKLSKRKTCDTLVFGQIMGKEKVFLIQNMCPVIEQYVENEYIDVISNTPVQIDGVLEKELVSKVVKVLTLERKGIHLVFPDIFEIEKKLFSLKTVSVNE